MKNAIKEAIIRTLAEANHPMRKRDIAAVLRCWVCDGKFLGAMYDLESAGTIKRDYHNDPANLEYYDEYYLA